MITRLHSSVTAKAMFSAYELPDAVQNPVLCALVTPRVISFSMMPALQAQDSLELGSAKNLQIGDLIVFRHQSLLICHRILQMDEEHIYTRGDAAQGRPEEIYRSDVVGRVTAIVRSGIRHSLDRVPLAERRPSGPARYAGESRERLRALAHRLFKTIPMLNRVVRWLGKRLMRMDVMERASLRSVTGYVKRHSCRASQVPKFLESPTMRHDPARITLVFRIGRLVLATARLDPPSLLLRPSAVTLGLETWLQSLCGR